MTLTFTQRLSAGDRDSVHHVLSLTAEERSRSRHPFETEDGKSVYLHLPRGTTLREGDWLKAESGELAQVRAKPEPVLTVTAERAIDLLQAAYHLGNRHVSLEITETYLRLSPDSVLQDLLNHRGLTVIEEIAPFQPETGAYGHHAH
ncbi:MAG: urease accessory protein UreE [Phormidesmis sp. CAN_BIN44]|nr:urease accessory protein UreE [Phormidesmis sp. CAN_BIN44]